MKTDVDIFPILNMDKHQCSFTFMFVVASIKDWPSQISGQQLD